MKRNCSILPEPPKILSLTGFVAVLLLLTISALVAKNLAAYSTGDIATENITAPIAFDVENSIGSNTTIVFRTSSNTNALVTKFLAQYAGARSNFITAVQDTFHQTTLDEKSVSSADFGYLITAFNIEHREFPVGGRLATDWARGESSLNAQQKLIDALLQAGQHPIRPDTVPDSVADDGTCYLVVTGRPGHEPDLRDLENAELLPLSRVRTLSEAREAFRREFSMDEQPLARAVSQWLEPNCIFDPKLTRIARENFADQRQTSTHYAAGQVIIQRGATIDAQTKAALSALQQMLEKSPATKQVTDSSDNPSLQSSPAIPSRTSQARLEIPSPRAKISGPAAWILATVSIISAAAIVLLRKRRVRPIPVRPIKYSAQKPTVLRSELGPIVQTIKETFIQELALQRREMILAQQQAAAEIVELIRRLDKLQVPIQERLKAFEREIQRLEKELAERTEENRELLKLRIELTRQQLEIERAGNRAKFN